MTITDSTMKNQKISHPKHITLLRDHNIPQGNIRTILVVLPGAH